MNPEIVQNILGKHEESQDGLISILEDIQNHFGYLPQEALQIVSNESGRPLVDIYGVATFYKSFSLKPRGRHLISVCLGTACHVRGAPSIAEEFERLLKISAGDTTPDQEFTLETINCLGACALGPVVVVDGHYFPNVKRTKVTEIIAKASEGIDKIQIETDKRVFPIEVSCPRCNHSLMDTRNLVDGYPSITITASFARKHGRLSLSCLYGSYNIASEYVIPTDTILNLFCPYCHADLSGGTNCAECGTAMVPMIVRGGGVVQVCPRRGCKGHMLDLSE